MQATTGIQLDVKAALKPTLSYLQEPVRFFRTYHRENFRPDFIAGLTLTVILLPQAIAYALIAELPPQMGLYTAMIRGLVGALWGSSNHLNNGPTNTVSLLILSSLVGIVEPGSSEFVIAAGLMTVMAGFLQFVMGMARLGVLVNFVSHSVVVGFATGAGVLIAIKQIQPLLGLDFVSRNIFETLAGIVTNMPQTHKETAVLGFSTIAIILVLRRLNPKIPGPLLGMVALSAVVYILRLDHAGVDVIGQLPQSLPPLTRLPVFNLDLIASVSTGALAVAAIGLVESMAIARTVATQSGQRIDSNQEFVGQGLANIVAGFFSGFAGGGSFTRTVVNFKSGGKTRMSAIFSSLLLLVAIFVLAPFAAFLPRTALAGVLIVTAYGMIDRAEIARIWSGTRGDALIMVLTLLGTLFLALEFAVLLGIMVSLAHYIMRTSMPRVQAVLPDENFKHFVYQPDKAQCLQLGIVDILGDIYFGAVNHIEEFILENAAQNPEQRFLMLRMHSVNQCDFSGVHMLESVVSTYRDNGGDVFLVRVSENVQRLLETTGFIDYLGEDNIVAEDLAISELFYHILDPAVCIYECPHRAFKECQNLPKQISLMQIDVDESLSECEVTEKSPHELWQLLHTVNGSSREPLIVDVREPREYKQGHIAEAQSLPLSRLLEQQPQLPQDRTIIFVCRSGRRSRRAAHIMQQRGRADVAIVQGGMLAWEAAGLLEAID